MSKKLESAVSAASSSLSLLSNESIYLPLSSYVSPISKEGSSSSRKRYENKVFKDYQVCDFFENVSKVYTGNDSQISWASNCPKSSTLVAAGTSAINRSVHLDGKIFARSLVLSGGVGESSSRKKKKRERAKLQQQSVATTTGSQRRMVGSISKRKRKKLCERAGFPMIISSERPLQPQQTQQLRIPGCSADDTATSPPKPGHLSRHRTVSNSFVHQHYQPLPSMITLYKLHSLWVSYVEKLLGPTLRQYPLEESNNSGSNDAATKDTAHIISCLLSKKFEICGALVQIIACPSHCHCNGKTGMIVDETRNTWRMITLKVKQNKKGTESISATSTAADFGEHMMNSVRKESNPADSSSTTKSICLGGSIHPPDNSNEKSIHLVIVPKRNCKIELKMTIGGYNLGIVINGNDTCNLKQNTV